MNMLDNLAERPSKLPIIIVTGASGFIGRNFLESHKYDFYIYAIARRAQKSVGIEPHENINWIRLDIGEEKMVQEMMESIKEKGGADYLLHLAGYYDYTNKDNDEYRRTNIIGTKYILEYARILNLKRFIFASSLTVTNFGKNGPVIDEKSPADATFPYALSKKEGEDLIREYSQYFPCVIMRCAAIFNDWCEYGPLFVLLSMWLEQKWDSNILTGRGEASIPYLHTKNLNSVINRIISNDSNLGHCDIIIASQDGCTSQRELHDISMRYNFGEVARLFYAPTWFAWIGVVFMNFAGLIRGKRPFIRPWMLKMTDKKMKINASNSRQILGWKPIERFDIKRRLLFLIENRKSNPYEWNRRNEEALHEGIVIRPNFKIYESMIKHESEIIDDILIQLVSEENQKVFPSYIKLDKKELDYRIKNLFKMLKSAVVLGDRLQVLSYSKSLALERFKEHFEAEEVISAITLVGKLIVEHLKSDENLDHMELRIHDEILLTVQLIIDEFEDSFDRLSGMA